MLSNQVFKEEKSRYREENGVLCIDLFLTSIYQLFDRRDPSPFREKDLDEDFIKFLIICIREIGNNKAKIVLKMPEHNPVYLKAHDIEEAINNFFSFEVKTVQEELKVLFKEGRWALFMGLIFLISCHVLIYLVLEGHDQLFMGATKEGLTVLGWVAFWKPMNIFLYEWWPYLDKIKMLTKLKTIKVEIITD